MTISEGFERIFNNAFSIIDMDFKDCKSYAELLAYEKTIDHNFIHELINWFAIHYNTDLLGFYQDYIKKCNSSFNDKVTDFINEDFNNDNF